MESTQNRKSRKVPGIVILLVGLLIGAAIPLAWGSQPYMDNALRHLQAARADLEKATPNKGGHRERAIQLVDQAIAQVRDGIKFAK